MEHYRNKIKLSVRARRFERERWAGEDQV